MATFPPPGTTLSANEAMVDLVMERAIDLLRLEAGTRDKVIALLHDLESDILAAIAKIAPTDPKRLSARRVRLETLLQLVENSIRATYRLNSQLLASEIREIVDQEATWTGRAINSSIHVEFATVGLTRNALATLVSDVMIQGAPSREWWGRQAQGLSDRFADEMRRGVALGETNADLVKRVRGTAEAPGLMQVSRVSAERLVRASVQTAANAGRSATYAANADLISAVMWHATLDTRTSIWCLARDGHKYGPVDHEPLDGAPPWLEGPGAIHWGCRSTSVPVLKSWRDLGIDMDEVPKTTRASMDGQVPAEQTFEAWLKKQTQERQNRVLGVGKADLWRSGKIGFRDLLDQSGRPLTTEALRARHG
jgi:hypothetical protein